MAAALILAAGFATRLHPLTAERPKSLLPIGSRVVLDWTLDALEALPAIQRIVLVTNAKFAAQFEAWLRTRPATVPVQVINDGATSDAYRLGAIRDLQLVLEQGHMREPLLVIAGDHILEWDLADFLRCAQAHLPATTVAVYALPDPAEAPRFGIARLDAQQRLIAFEEKPAHPQSHLAVVCVYYFQPQRIQARLTEYLATNQPTDAPGFFIGWLSAREPVYGWLAQGRLFDIGTLETYAVAQQTFAGA